MKWKSKLLASGLPLEHEATVQLRKMGFHVDGEFPYTRHGGPHAEDCSVDLISVGYLPLEDNSSFSARLILLVECKHRSDSKAWLFTPDINEPDFSPSWPGGVRYFRHFTTYTVEERPVFDLNASPDPVLKGVEINLESGETFDRDIKHGVNQLRYALPSAIHREVLNNLDAHPEDCRPFFILPILVTNAAVFVSREDFSTAAVKDASSFDDLVSPRTWLDLHMDHSESFRQHCMNTFSDLSRLRPGGIGQRSFDAIYQSLDESKREMFSPFADLWALSRGLGLMGQRNIFKQFWICTAAAFPDIVQRVAAAVSAAVKNTVRFAPAAEARLGGGSTVANETNMRLGADGRTR